MSEMGINMAHIEAEIQFMQRPLFTIDLKRKSNNKKQCPLSQSMVPKQSGFVYKWDVRGIIDRPPEPFLDRQAGRLCCQEID